VQSAFPVLVLYDTSLGQALQPSGPPASKRLARLLRLFTGAAAGVVGINMGEAVGPCVGEDVGPGVGEAVGPGVGEAVGPGVGSVVSPPKPARHCPVLVPPQPEELGSHVVHPAFPALVLYDTPLRQAVQLVVALPP